MSTIKYYSNGNKRLEIFKNDKNLIHRENGPAKIFYSKNGKVFAEIYYDDGKIHRYGDKPAEIYYDAYGIRSEIYYNQGKISRKGDKPAFIEYKSGVIAREIYYKDGKIHRDEKPAFIEYDEDGDVKREIYYKNNRRIYNDEENVDEENVDEENVDEENVDEENVDEDASFLKEKAIRNKIYQLKGGEITDEIKMEIKELFDINPWLSFLIIREFDINNLYYSNCANITFKTDDVFIEYNDQDKKFWCYDTDEVGDKDRYNPYTLKNLRRSFGTNVQDKSVKISSKAFNIIHLWTGNYTEGKIFFKIDKDVAFELSKTLDSNKKYILYRGLEFDSESGRNKFLKRSKCNQNYCSDIEFRTFSSWSYDYDVAAIFSRDNGVIIKKEFKADQLLADLTKINVNYDRIDIESEVIVLPFKGDVEIIS